MANEYLDKTGLNTFWQLIKTAINTLITMVNGKVDKEGDTMTGDLDMSSNNIINCGELDMTGDIEMQDYGIYNCSFIEGSGDKDTVRFDSHIGLEGFGFYQEEDNIKGTDLHLVQGDGHFRTIQTMRDDGDDLHNSEIPTGEVIEQHVSSKISDIKIGGVNLIEEGAWTNVTATTDKYLGHTVYTAKYLSGSYTDITATENLTGRLRNAGTYTVSFYAKASAAITDTNYNNIGHHLYNVKQGTTGYLTNKVSTSWGYTGNSGDGQTKNISLSTAWRQYSITWELVANIPESTNVIPRLILFRIMKAAAGTTIYFAGVKFEYGNKVTDWSPALTLNGDNIGNIVQRLNVQPHVELMCIGSEVYVICDTDYIKSTDEVVFFRYIRGKNRYSYGDRITAGRRTKKGWRQPLYNAANQNYKLGTDYHNMIPLQLYLTGYIQIENCDVWRVCEVSGSVYLSVLDALKTAATADVSTHRQVNCFGKKCGIRIRRDGEWITDYLPFMPREIQYSSGTFTHVIGRWT